MTSIKAYIIDNWSKGLVNRIKGEAKFPKGGASGNTNWLTAGDHIELRRGQAVMGTSIPGAGRVTGIRVCKKLNAALTQVLTYSYDRKVKYFDDASLDFVEYGTDMLPAAANGEDIAFEEYDSLSGAFMFFSSPNSSIYKAPVANPGSYVDLKNYDFRGKIKIRNSSMYMWDRKDAYGGSDKTGLIRSWIDKDELVDYPFVEHESLGTGNGVNQAFSGTLTQINKATVANAKRTSMYVRVGAPSGAAKTITAISQANLAQVTAAAHGLVEGNFITIQGVVGMTQINGAVAFVSRVVDVNNVIIDVNSTGYTAYASGGSLSLAEVFTDNRDGTLTGSAGGTGTTNYVTGAVSLTTAAAVTNARDVYTEYYYEDSTDADSGTANTGAIVDFTRSIPRLPLEAFTLRQDDAGGPFQNMFSLGGSDYCMHTAKTWKVDLAVTDDDVSNLPYRRKIGIEYWRGGQETSQGILYIDSQDKLDAYINRLELQGVDGLAEPVALSETITFVDYRFDAGVIYEYGDYILVACRHKSSTINDTCFLYNKVWKSWDKLDYRISCAETYNGALIGGDSGSKNLFTLFSGLTDEESEIPNAWTSGPTNLDAQGIKSVRRCLLAGNIGPDQEMDFQISGDNGPFVTYKTISGKANYVDKTQRVLVGANTLGTEMVGGGGDGIEAYHYRYEFNINTANFEKLRYQFVAKKVGYVSVAELQFKDIRYKGQRAALKYVADASNDDLA